MKMEMMEMEMEMIRGCRIRDTGWGVFLRNNNFGATGLGVRPLEDRTGAAMRTETNNDDDVNQSHCFQP